MPTPQQLEAASRAGYSPQQIKLALARSGASSSQPQQKSIGGFAGNVVKSGANAVGGIVSGAVNTLNPNMQKNTLAQMGRLTAGATQLLDPTQGNKIANALPAGALFGDQEQTARDVGSFYNQRYGVSDFARGDIRAGGQKVLNTAYTDPVGVALDASTVLGGAGAVAKGVGATRTGANLTRAGAAIDPFVQGGRAMKTGVSGALSRGGASLEKAGKNYAIRGYGQPKTIEKFGKKYRPAQDVISDYSLYGKDTKKLADVIESLQAEFDSIARTSGRTVSVEDIFNTTIAKIDELTSSGFDDDALLARQLEKKLEAFIDANPDSAVDIGKATEQRIGYDKRVKTFATDPVLKGANQQMRDIFQGEIRKSADGLTTPSGENLSQTGQRLSELYAFQPIMEQAAATGSTVRPLSVGKLLSAAAGGAAAGVPGAIAMYGADVVASNPKVMGATSKLAQGAGSWLQSAKLPSSKLISKPYGVFKGVNVFNRPTNRKTNEPRLTLESQQEKESPLSYPGIVPSRKNVFRKSR